MNERYSRCKACKQGFFYTPKGSHGRLREYCPNCAGDHVRKGTRERVAAYRQRQREAKARSTKRSSGAKPRPVSVDTREETERVARTPKGRGLFANVPDPGRTQSRKRLGLP